VDGESPNRQTDLPNHKTKSSGQHATTATSAIAARAA
jgi:hypothetical protein